MYLARCVYSVFFFFQAEDGIRDVAVTGVQTCALPIFMRAGVLQIGATSTLTLTSNTPARMIMIGRCDKHPGAIPPTTIYWNDLVVDWKIGRASCRERV